MRSATAVNEIRRRRARLPGAPAATDVRKCARALPVPMWRAVSAREAALTATRRGDLKHGTNAVSTGAQCTNLFDLQVLLPCLAKNRG
jgi:hypothetical protein